MSRRSLMLTELFAMLFITLLCLSSFATVMPAFGLWNRMNSFRFGNKQIPLGRIPDPANDAQLEFEGSFVDEKHQRNDTIWDVIDNDTKFSKLAKAIQFADAVDHFNNSDANLTFFATPDWALPSHDAGCSKLFQWDYLDENDVVPTVLTQSCHWHTIVSAAEKFDTLFWFDDDKGERRKKFFKQLVRAILAYETLPEAVDVFSLGDNTTYATKLSFPGVLGGQPLRVRIEEKLLPPSININFYSKIVYPNVKASNGIIHTVNHPLLPPISAFQTLFLVPSKFSILTSAIQRVGLVDDTDLRFSDENDDDGRHKIVGAPLLTLFAPQNSAFERLPKKLKLFLFSPLGHNVLRKILEYHIVPNLLVHSDYQFNKSNQIALSCGDGQRRHNSRGKLISNCHLDLPTLFDNRTVHAHIKRTEITLPVPGPKKPILTETEFLVNHHEVLVHDVVTSNAAVHIVDHLLNPRDRRGCRDVQGRGWTEEGCDVSWEGWEGWLVRWADST